MAFILDRYYTCYDKMILPATCLGSEYPTYTPLCGMASCTFHFLPLHIWYGDCR